jgi:hypothetical protein
MPEKTCKKRRFDPNTDATQWMLDLRPLPRDSAAAD